MSKLLLGVSGGPDSMMLLDSLVNAKKEVVVAHVNYQKRPTAFRDEKIVVDYCEKHQLALERLYPYQRPGNFQNWAREVRYAWFKELTQYYGCDQIAIGHQLNDMIETYLLQKQRRSVVRHYGLPEYTKWDKVTIYRPLLNYSKAEVLAYCRANNLTYGWDETNDEEFYQRNKLRQQIGGLSKDELLAYHEKIKKENEVQQKFLASIDYKKAYQKQELRVRLQLLSELLKENAYYYFTTKHLLEIDRQLLAKRHYKYHKKFFISLQNNHLQLQKLMVTAYSYLLNELQYQQYPYFILASQGPSNSGVEIFPSDWPITIRTWQAGDRLKMKYGTKKVSRFFIDNKIALSQREIWPLVVNCHNEVILVPGWGADIAHYTDKQNLYVIKL